jgi:inner membrane protein
MNTLLEWLTHALLGAIVAEWLLGKKIGNVAMQWGALLGTAPDLLEIPPAIFLDTTRTLQWQQGPLHSFAAATLVAWAFASVFAKSWKKQKITRSGAFWWIFATWSSHSLLDTLTIDGAAIFWPLPFASLPPRISFNLLHAIGPVPPLLMALTLLRVSRLKTKKQLTARRRALIRGCGLTAAWFLVCLTIKLINTAGFNADLKRRNVTGLRCIESPVGFNLIFRRAVVQGTTEFRIGYRSLFEPFSSSVRWTIYPTGDPAPVAVSPDPTFLETRKILSRHANGWVIERSHSRGLWIADLRHPEHRIWGEKKGMVDSRFPHAWNVFPNGRGDNLQALHDTRHKPTESTRRMMARTFGNQAIWEGNPRLAGVTGRLPEFLPVEE